MAQRKRGNLLVHETFAAVCESTLQTEEGRSVPCTWKSGTYESEREAKTAYYTHWYAKHDHPTSGW
jgi:hypothetical protein